MRTSSPLLVLAFAACGADPAPLIGDVEVGVDTLGCATGCDDGDPCTDDLCQADGSCLHVARNPFGACQHDGHCDDENVCSADACREDECGLMRCVNDFDDVSCRACDPSRGAADCSDGNPCTIDRCGEDGRCEESAPDPLCTPECAPDIAMNVDSARFQWPGSRMPVIGRAGPSLRFCDVDCACTTGVALEGFSGVLGLVQPVDAEATWGCAVEVCESPSASCQPLVAGREYVVWGTALQRRDAAPQADTAQADVGMPPPQIDALQVEGWCLSASAAGLAGTWRATFERDGMAATFALTTTQDFANPNALTGQLAACTGACEALGFGTASARVTRDDAGFSLTLEAPGGPLSGRMRAGREAFVGDLLGPDGAFFARLTLAP